MAKLEQLTRSFAKGFHDVVTTADTLPDVSVVPMGLPTFDKIIQDVGGFPRGRVSEGHGFESSGKSTWGHAMSAAGSRLDPEFVTLWLDVEGCFEPKWAARMGQKLSHTIIPNDLFWMEDYLKAIKWGIVNNVDLIVLDSLPTLVPRIVGERTLKTGKDGKVLANQDEMEEDERALKMNEMLTRAKIFSQNMQPDLTSGFHWGEKKYKLKDSDTHIYLINQLRSSPDSGGFLHVDNVTPGGHAIKHLCSVRWQFTKRGVSKQTTEKGKPVDQLIRIKSIKNKVGTPYGQGDFILTAAGGFLEVEDGLVQTATRLGLVEGSGGRYVMKHDGTKLHGKTKLFEYLRNHPDIWEQVSGFNNIVNPIMTYGDGEVNHDAGQRTSAQDILNNIGR